MFRLMLFEVGCEVWCLASVSIVRGLLHMSPYQLSTPAMSLNDDHGGPMVCLCIGITGRVVCRYKSYKRCNIG